MSGLILTLSVVLICFLVTTYIAYILYSTRKLIQCFGQGPIFDRSPKLCILAIISNYIEIIFNLLTGLFHINSGHSLNTSVIITLTISIFSTRFYAAVMALRAYRISVLHKCRSGSMPVSSISEISIYKNILIKVLIYSTITTLPAPIIYSTNKIETVYLVYTMILYGIESLFFLISFFLILRTATHPSILLEQFLYSVIWVSGIFTINNNLEDRWLILVPVRNSCLIFIMFLSLKVHCYLLRPPFPSFPKYSEFFEIKELYEDFLLYTEANSPPQIIEACILSKELAKSLFYLNFKSFIKCLKSTTYSGTFMEYVNEGNFDSVRENLEAFLSPYIRQYLCSIEYKELKKRYFVLFN